MLLPIVLYVVLEVVVLGKNNYLLQDVWIKLSLLLAISFVIMVTIKFSNSPIIVSMLCLPESLSILIVLGDGSCAY